VWYLHSRNVDVHFLVTGLGQSEDHIDLKPHEIELNWVFRKLKRLVGAQSVAFTFDYKWGLPSWGEIREFFHSGFDAIVVRSPYSLLALTYAATARLAGTRVVFYTQRPLYRVPDTIRDTTSRGLIAIFSARWITPCAGDTQNGRALKGMYYVPFCASARNLDRKWFNDDCVNIVSVGKFVERKNHDLLMRSLETLTSKVRFRLTIVGEISDVTGKSYFRRIADMARQMPFEVNLRVNLDREEVFRIYEDSDLFVLASEREPASVSNLEAMSCGLPIIVSDSNQTACYIDDNGLIFESGSAADLSAKLEKIMSDREFLIQCGDKSKELVAEHHASDKVYRFLLEEILEK
jgi:glycosyltransferase involved in cell wall biosynthesis